MHKTSMCRCVLHRLLISHIPQRTFQTLNVSLMEYHVIKSPQPSRCAHPQLHKMLCIRLLCTCNVFCHYAKISCNIPFSSVARLDVTVLHQEPSALQQMRPSRQLHHIYIYFTMMGRCSAWRVSFYCLDNLEIRGESLIESLKPDALKYIFQRAFLGWFPKTSRQTPLSYSNPKLKFCPGL